VILLGGCASATEQAHQRFFAAVKADPLFTWRPDWVTSDKYAERSGDQPFSEETGASLTRLLVGSPLPAGAADAAGAFATEQGWSPDIPQYFRKNLTTWRGVSGCRLLIGHDDSMTSLTLEFVSWTELP
jgi:hypothetical protein